MQLLIPCAGAGSRFAAAGYKEPKPLILVDGIPMVEWVVLDVINAFGPLSRTVFCARSPVDQYFGEAAVTVPGLTGGAAETVMLAEARLDPEEALVIANCDQRFSLPAKFETFADVGVVCFECPERSSKWSYVYPNGQIVEKPPRPESDLATCGIYYFRRAGDFFDAARRMFAAGEAAKVNGEFYLAPVINFYPPDATKTVALTSYFHGLGTPEDLNDYVRGGL